MLSSEFLVKGDTRERECVCVCVYIYIYIYIYTYIYVCVCVCFKSAYVDAMNEHQFTTWP